ncbi:hypothetical protein TNCV_1303201 [Trichonephila clavipes]|nr:hypothetical protein TNCV_1303201 [Trichonephila clavipes]
MSLNLKLLTGLPVNRAVNRKLVTKAFSPPRRAILCKNAAQHGLLPSHDTHPLTEFTALAVLLPAITEPSVLLYAH